jgi:hypothetical protein
MTKRPGHSESTKIEPIYDQGVVDACYQAMETWRAILFRAPIASRKLSFPDYLV